MAEPIVRRALVTGANRGLGLEFVRQLLARGDRVIATCRDPARASALADMAAAQPQQLQVVAADLADADSLQALAAEAGRVYDGLDLLINNAGVLVPGETLGNVSAESLQTTLAINTIGPFLLTQALVPLLAKGHRALVANISSQLGSIDRTSNFHTPSYAISKAALNMASVLLAQALANQKVRVMALHPGWVRTDMGGENATLSPAQSVDALLEVLDRLGPLETGRFLDYQGEPIPW